MQTHIVTELAMDSEKSYLLEQLAAVSATPNSPRFAEFKELALLKGSGFRVQGVLVLTTPLGCLESLRGLLCCCFGILKQIPE